MRMTFKKDIHLVLASVRKGWGSTVVEEVQGKVLSSTLLRGNSSSGPDSKKSILGFALNEEREVIVMTVEADCLDEVIHTTIEAGGVNGKDGGVCMSLPLDRMYISDSAGEAVPAAPQEAPAVVVRPEEEAGKDLQEKERI